MVGVSSLTCWARQVEPKATREGRPCKIDLEKLAQDVSDHSDAYRYESAARFGVTPKVIWQALQKLDVTYKKAQKHSKADDVKRQVFRKRLSVIA